MVQKIGAPFQKNTPRHELIPPAVFKIERNRAETIERRPKNEKPTNILDKRLIYWWVLHTVFS